MAKHAAANIQSLLPISTTTISSPVNYVDITLPAGFSAFDLVYSGVKGNADIGLTAAFSQNGGTSWLSDYEGAYSAHRIHEFTIVNGLGSGQSGTDAVMTLCGGSTGLFNHGRMNINPGSASVPAFVHGFFCGETDDESQFRGNVYMAVCSLNTARVNAIRFLTANNADPNSITATDTLVAGVISLYGVL
jgi:hypothetical protein